MRRCDARAFAARDDGNAGRDGNEPEALARNANFDLPQGAGRRSEHLRERIDERHDVIRGNDDAGARDGSRVESIGARWGEDQFHLHGITAGVRQPQPIPGVGNDERPHGDIERRCPAATDRDAIVVLNQQARRRTIFRAHGEVRVSRQG